MMTSTTEFDRQNGGAPTLPESIRYRLDVVFAAAALTVLAGLLTPVSMRILDAAWIGSICLAAAVVLVCAVAKSCYDLQGFGFLVGILMLVRISLTAMTVRKILVEHAASTVIDILGRSTAGMGAIGAAVVALLLAIVGYGSILPAANRIRQAAQRYAGEILPIKRAALQAELGLKKIPREQARDILEKIRMEMRFFGSMGAVAVLMRCEAAAGLVMIVVSLTLKALTDAMAGGYNAEFLNILAANAAGLVIVSVFPSVAANWSCAALSRKDSLCLKTARSAAEEENNSRKIQVVSASTGNSKQIELLNPDFIDKARFIGGADEKIAEFEPEGTPRSNLIEYPIHALHSDTAQQYYQKMTDLILSLCKDKDHGVLLTSPANTPLSAAVAVNAAIGLAGRGKKVLLIDGEPHRNATARAFELDPAKTMSRPQATCIENLSVFTAGHADTQAGQRIVVVMEELQDQFDRVLLYGPQRMQLLADKTADRLHALIFAKIPPDSKSISLAAGVRDFASATVLPMPPRS